MATMSYAAVVGFAWLGARGLLPQTVGPVLSALALLAPALSWADRSVFGWGRDGARRTLQTIGMLLPVIAALLFWFGLPAAPSAGEAFRIAGWAVAEQLYFFGFLQPRIAVASWARVPVASALFAIAHIPHGGLAGLHTFWPGLAFAWAFDRSGSVWPGVLFHVSCNLLFVAGG